MKKFLLILMLFPMLSWGQNFDNGDRVKMMAGYTVGGKLNGPALRMQYEMPLSTHFGLQFGASSVNGVEKCVDAGFRNSFYANSLFVGGCYETTILKRLTLGCDVFGGVLFFTHSIRLGNNNFGGTTNTQYRFEFGGDIEARYHITDHFSAGAYARIEYIPDFIHGNPITTLGLGLCWNLSNPL